MKINSASRQMVVNKKKCRITADAQKMVAFYSNAYCIKMQRSMQFINMLCVLEFTLKQEEGRSA